MQRPSGFLALCFIALLTGCAIGGPASAPLPMFGLGDSYQFDDGTVRRVAETSGDAVSWEGNADEKLVTRRDTLLPPLHESTPHMAVRRRISGPDLFPLIPGKIVTFTAATERIDGGKPRSAEEQWHCKVGDPIAVSTPAGRFDTIRVDCAARSASGPSVQRSYFYAPSIGYYVRREERIGSGPVHAATLTRFTAGNPMLTDSALRRRVRSIQLALERDVSGNKVTWRDPSSNASGSVDPVLTVRSPHDGWCRQFREQLLTAGREYDLQGTACRDPAGIWQVREVSPYDMAAR